MSQMTSIECLELIKINAEQEAGISILEADGSVQVYILQENGIGAVKIGVTKNLNRRLSSMRSNSPHQIDVVLTIDADERLESYLKDLFHGSHIRGEWFRATPEMAAFVKSVHENSDFLEHLKRIRPPMLTSGISSRTWNRIVANHVERESQ